MPTLVNPKTCPETAFDLNPQRIGQILLRVVPASAAMGHSTPRSTMQNYSPRTGPEMEFVRDMLTLPTDELAERWYGGVDSASRLACEGRPGLPDPSEL